MTIFNPDPKLQAQAMIEMFLPYVSYEPIPNFHPIDIREPQWESAKTTRKKNAKSCALIAAEMCFWVANAYCPTITEPPNPAMKDVTYWRDVIEELKKP